MSGSKWTCANRARIASRGGGNLEGSRNGGAHRSEREHGGASAIVDHARRRVCARALYRERELLDGSLLALLVVALAKEDWIRLREQRLADTRWVDGLCVEEPTRTG